jgi:hypothetical protein
MVVLISMAEGKLMSKAFVENSLLVKEAKLNF